MNFFEQAGKMALGSRLRIISEKMLEDATRLYQLYDVPIQPKWFPVFFMLSQESQMAVTDIAKAIGHSHPSVSKTVKEMAKAGLVTETKDKKDKRRNLVGLSKNGKAIISRANDQFMDVNDAVEDALTQTRHDIWKAIDELEFLLEEKSLYRRVIEKKKAREAQFVEIVAYQPKYKKAFKSLNEDWIDTYFKLEEEDRKLLDNPKKSIINKGGYIYIALYKGEPVGTCALVPMDDPDYEYELGKMAVSDKAQGKGIGWLLGRAVAQKAKALGAEKLYLESNAILKPAIQLYRKMGFQKVSGRSTPYDRCNVQMELILDHLPES